MTRMDCSEFRAKALRCRRLQWWRCRHLHWKQVEKDKRAGPHPKRFKIYRWENIVLTEASKVCGNVQMVLQNLYHNRQDGYTLLRIVGSGVTLREQGKCGPQLVGGGVVRWLRMATRGDGWPRMETIGGVEWRRMAANDADSGVACGRLVVPPILGTECCGSFQRSGQNVQRFLSVVQEECLVVCLQCFFPVSSVTSQKQEHESGGGR